MSKEAKLAKKEKKAAKKAAKLEKTQAKQYASLVKSIEKKNAKLEKKASKKGKPFVPLAIPTLEEAFASGAVSKKKEITKMIILILLLCYAIYFIIMWHYYIAPQKVTPEDSQSEPAVYDPYVNEHEITTTPDYSVAEAKALLKQVIKDNYHTLGYSSDPSSGSINYTGSIATINDADCYEFKAAGKTYYVSIKLSAVYNLNNGEYIPYTFHGTTELEFDN